MLKWWGENDKRVALSYSKHLHNQEIPMAAAVTGAEDIRWDLTALYNTIDDPLIDRDIQTLSEMIKMFHTSFKGRLSQELGPAISRYAHIRMLEDKIMLYLFLKQSTNVGDAAVKSKIADTERMITSVSGEYLSFFAIELVSIDEGTLRQLYEQDSVVAQHRPWIEHARILKPHLLSEPVESALTKRSPFGPSAWSEFFDELEADIEVQFGGEKKTLTELLHLLTESRDPEERSQLMLLINESLKGTFAKYSAQTLYMVVGAASVENQERFYAHPMAARNTSNRIDGHIVDALHRIVNDVAGPLARRYYRLKGAHLGLKPLKWSDRNAPLSFADTTIVSFAQAKETIRRSFESFSPRCAELAMSFFDKQRIDAPYGKGKRGGAFNYSVVLPGAVPISYVFLNYLGSNRDVMTLAHELGHGVHGLLAGKSQGTLMSQAPIAYAETASVFAEMTTFKFLKSQLVQNNDRKSLLALIMGKIDDSINTLVRQISFSNFERRLHGFDPTTNTWNQPRKLSAEQLSTLWIDMTRQLYGDHGDVFTYENADHLWSYISHFHHPFYVYGYALGELLTQSLYAQQTRIGARFESLYIDLLSSGSTRNIIALLKPFDLDPTDDRFWISGIEAGLGALVAEAELLSGELGISVS
ncbi:MAG: M3 family metallopeptidase [Endomicrobiales bacterium]|jgi:oligoendopeptidase F